MSRNDVLLIFGAWILAAVLVIIDKEWWQPKCRRWERERREEEWRKWREEYRRQREEERRS